MGGFDDNDNQVVWDIRLSENELRGDVYFGDLQTAAFTLVDSQQDKIKFDDSLQI